MYALHLVLGTYLLIMLLLLLACVSVCASAIMYNYDVMSSVASERAARTVPRSENKNYRN